MVVIYESRVINVWNWLVITSLESYITLVEAISLATERFR